MYIDDIIVLSRSFPEHLQHVVLPKEKSATWDVISAAGVPGPDPGKVEAVSFYPAPRDDKELKQFLGVANYYCRFVADYSQIPEPLHNLLRKEERFHWDSSWQKTFDALKQKLVSPPILAFLDFNQQFILYTDASDVAIGGILGQFQDDQ